MSLFWFFILADFLVFFMQRTAKTWKGANQNIPLFISLIANICSVAIIVLLVFIFIKVKPWWYGLVMIAVGYITPLFLPPLKTVEVIVSLIGMVAAPLFVVLSFLKLFAVI